MFCDHEFLGEGLWDGKAVQAKIYLKNEANMWFTTNLKAFTSF